MHVALRSTFFIPLVILLGLASGADAQTHTTTFTNNTPIEIPVTVAGQIPATIYPSTITVAGVVGVTYHMSVTINISHAFSSDVDIVLVSPAGEAVMLLSDVGGDFGTWTNVKLVLDDCAPRSLRNVVGTPSGRYRPSDVYVDPGGGAVAGDALPTPAPGGSYGKHLANFNWASPNGVWKLFVSDDFGNAQGGSISNWSLAIYDQPSAAASLPTTSAINPIPCVAPDYDGDGRTDVAVYRPLTGEWFIAQSGSSGALMQAAWGAPSSFNTGDIQVPADYDGDGITDLAVYRQTTGDWFIRRSSDLSLLQASFGAPSSFGLGDTPVPGDYDGDGQADIAIYRAATGQWFLRSSAGLGGTITTWGVPAAGDTPARR
jgi:subtilisin-like proprotein convertase family protein